jgi:hypothetical protein
MISLNIDSEGFILLLKKADLEGANLDPYSIVSGKNKFLHSITSLLRPSSEEPVETIELESLGEWTEIDSSEKDQLIEEDAGIDCFVDEVYCTVLLTPDEVSSEAFIAALIERLPNGDAQVRWSCELSQLAKELFVYGSAKDSDALGDNLVIVHEHEEINVTNASIPLEQSAFDPGQLKAMLISEVSPYIDGGISLPQPGSLIGFSYNGSRIDIEQNDGDGAEYFVCRQEIC